MKIKFILCFILLASFLLNVYGINWGLPYKWNVDEQVGVTLRMFSSKTLLSTQDEFGHPTLYFYCLGIFLAPYLLLLKMLHYPFNLLQSAASVSWFKVAIEFPSFATNIYLFSRLLSGIFGAICVYFVYLTGKSVFNQKVGLFSAAVLALTKGFVGVNHFANSTGLVNLLGIVTIYLCVKYLDEEGMEKHILLAGYFGGLSLAAKYNGFILLIPICMSIFLKYYSNLKAEVSIIHLKFFNAVVIGYFFKYKENFFIKYQEYISPDVGWAHLKGFSNYLYRLLDIFGIPLAIFVFIGLLYYLINIKKNTSKTIILALTVVIYLTIISSWQRPALVKYIVFIIPILSIFAGKMLYEFSQKKMIPLYIRFTILTFVFVFSIAYAFSFDLIFAKNDTRYIAGRWAKNNINTEKTIEIFTQPAWVLSPDLFLRHNIVFLGKSSCQTGGKNIYSAFKDRNKEHVELEEYFKQLNLAGSSSDYIIIPYFNDKDNYILTGPEGDKFIYNLITKRLNYQLVKEISLHKHWFWDLRMDYLSPTLLIFKRIKT